MPYTIVLTPPKEQAEKYIAASQALYSDFQPDYLLASDGTSSPHITIVQFECHSLDLANQVWKKMCEKMNEENVVPLIPKFTGVSFITGTGIYENKTWVELSVQRGDSNSPLMKVHAHALDILIQFNLMPLNLYGDYFRPHLTLSLITLPEQMKTWPKNLCENLGSFKLEFGLSDDKWQYAKSLASFP